MKFKLIPLMAATVSVAASANDIGPLKETRDFGEMSIGAAYYYAESDWGTSSSTGDNLAENVIRDGIVGRFTFGLHPDLEVFVKTGLDSIQKGSSSGLSSENDTFFSLGAKAVLYQRDRLMVGPFIQYSEYSDYQISSNAAANALQASIKALSTVETGVAAMYALDRIDLYGGLYYYRADADVSASYGGNEYTAEIEEDADYGVYAGARYALGKRWHVAAEMRSTSNLGGAVSVNYVFGQKKSQAAEIQRVVETVYVERTAPVGPARLESDVHFGSGSTEIDPDHLPNVREFAYFLKQYPQARGIIEGHCDCDGSDTFNLELSARRSQAIVDMLVRVFGIEPARLTIENFGEQQPVADNESDTGKAANRRVRMVGIAD
ncbi:MAG: OmpA family protein [Gammaproteobacteria bacterium]|nr:OmpA family protein [Gammaproteobacteria bacterium]